MTRDEPPKIDMWWCLLKNRTVNSISKRKNFPTDRYRHCHPEIDQLSLFFFMTIALEKSESVLADDADI